MKIYKIIMRVASITTIVFGLWQVNSTPVVFVDHQQVQAMWFIGWLLFAIFLELIRLGIKE